MIREHAQVFLQDLAYEKRGVWIWLFKDCRSDTFYMYETRKVHPILIGLKLQTRLRISFYVDADVSDIDDFQYFTIKDLRIKDKKKLMLWPVRVHQADKIKRLLLPFPKGFIFLETTMFLNFHLLLFDERDRSATRAKELKTEMLDLFSKQFRHKILVSRYKHWSVAEFIEFLDSLKPEPTTLIDLLNNEEFI